jgi:hypothetical protein
MSRTVDLTDYTEEELIELNRRIVERLRSLHQQRRYQEMARFNLGDTVSFTAEAGRTVAGKVIRANAKTITILSSTGGCLSPPKVGRSRSSGPLLGVISGGWTSSWMEDSEQAQLRSSGVLDAVNLSARQENAATSLNQGVRFAGPDAARALENTEHLFVVVKVIRRAPGRNAAHELRRFVAAKLLVDEDSVPSIPGGFRDAIAKPYDRIYRRPIAVSTEARHRREPGTRSRFWALRAHDNHRISRVVQ